MSNRIDLTQFEGMTKGPWRWDNDDYGAYVFTDNGEDGLQIASIESGEDNDASAIAKLPTLIAELKRCYEQLDAVKHEVENCSECGGHREEEGTFHYCQNYCRCEEFDASL